MSDDHHRHYGYAMADLIGFLRRAGFQTYLISATRTLRPIDERFAAAGVHELVAIRELSDFARRTGWAVE